MMARSTRCTANWAGGRGWRGLLCHGGALQHALVFAGYTPSSTLASETRLLIFGELCEVREVGALLHILRQEGVHCILGSCLGSFLPWLTRVWTLRPKAAVSCVTSAAAALHVFWAEAR